jgi:tripartite-type tricarboxylate transporter receptor subunit TctC
MQLCYVEPLPKLAFITGSKNRCPTTQETSPMPAPLQGFKRRRVLAAVLLGAALPSIASAQAAAAYPSKPIRFIVPFPAGISPDVVARQLAEKLSVSMGQPVIVENRPGAAGMIGAESVAKSAGDGYTVFMSVLSIMAFNPHVYPKVNYDPLKDFVPVTEVAVIPHMLVATNEFPAKTLQELLAHARSNPGRVDFASPGVGSAPHIMMEMLGSLSRTQMNHVPFKSSGLMEVIGGQVNISFEAITTAMPQIKAGKVRALAVTETRRVAQLPDVPSIAEVLPGYAIDSWQGIFVPAKTPKDIVARLNSEFIKAIRSPDVQKKFDELGFRTVANSPEEFSAVMARDYETWGQAVRKLNIKANF